MTKEKDYFQTFCKLSEAFGTAATMEGLLEMIVCSATEAMAAKAACLFLADYKQNVFIPQAQWGLSDTYLHASPIKAQKVVAALKKKGHLFFEDATTDPQLENHEAKKAEGIASILTVPVMVDDYCIGVLSLYTAKKRKFSKNDITFLKALATSGGISVKKARLLQRIERNATLFLELASAINSSLDIRQILGTMSEKMTKAMGMKGATIRLLNETTGDLDLVADFGLSDAFLSKGPVSGDKSVSDTLKGKTVVIEDISKDKRLQYPEATQKEGISSMISVPVRSRDRIIGIMRLYCECVRKYPRDFITIIEALAHTGALAIENASMYLALKEDKKSLEEDIWSHRAYF
jgi:GAF domain-containing protein